MKQKTWITFGFSLAACLALATPSAKANDTHLKWSNQLVLFAPLDRSHPVVDPEALEVIPKILEVGAAPEFPSMNLEPKRVDWQPGRPIDLAPYVGEDTEDTAYVFAEINSPVEQTVTLGLGADWWVQCWMNGEPFFDTLDAGNPSGRFSILNNKVEVKLREGKNILAMRLVRGLSSAILALGDESMFAAERRRQAERFGLNQLPENFSDRLLFPEREQAIISSGWDIDLSPTEADLSEGALVGLETMPERQMYLNTSSSRPALLDTLNRRFEEPVNIRLAKYRHPYEDRHLDAIVWTSPPDADDETYPSGRIEVLLKDDTGEVLARHDVDELSRSGLFFSVGFPPQLEGGEGALEVVWYDGGTEIARAEEPFSVEVASDVATSGRIPVEIINEPGAVINGAPMTTGVPFPRGALENETNLRLVDEESREVPLQTKITARWSRFGPIKWVLCDFTADLDGGPRQFYLEYGPDIERRHSDNMTVETVGEGFPEVDAGRIRVNQEGAIEFDSAGDGNFREVLSSAALHGAFVEHENGQIFTMSKDVEHALEEVGSEKVVVRRAGWYRDAESGGEFCNYVTRFVFHRDSPVVRIFHTWIFTGDGNNDRITDMGWAFPASQPFASEGILSSFDGGVWYDSDYLVQFDYQEYDLGGGLESGRHEGRAPGVMSGRSGGTRVTFGVKDFWQSFPSELEVNDAGLTFYNWPKNNPPASLERPIARADAFRNRFVHEGELLDFRLPEEYAKGEIWRESSSRERHWLEGRPETANAQGIARTEEMFLYLSDDSVDRDDAAKVMRGLDNESLRAMVDPVWMTGSGVFNDGDVAIHPRDEENFPEIERIYDLTMEAPRRWVEQLGVYGMWLHGDYPTWNINLGGQTVSTYRTFRGNHHAYPLRWFPYIRSGDPRFFKLAENATRRLVDANFCHYATEDIDRMVGPDHFRRQGRWDRSLLPWTGRLGPHLRSYTVDSDYMWDTYYMTGYGRARDVALLFGELTQHDHVSTSPGMVRRTRALQSMMTSYLDMYQATYDPWFIDAAHGIADMYLELAGDPGEIESPVFSTGLSGHSWRAACQNFYAFTGRPDYWLQARNNAVAYSCPYGRFGGVGYHGAGGGNMRMSAHAWRLTGDPYYLHRLAAGLELAKIQGYEGEIDYRLGLPAGGHGGGPTTNALAIPMAMSILASVDEDLDPIHTAAAIGGSYMGDSPGSQQRIAGSELPEGYHFEYPVEVIIRHQEEGPLDWVFDMPRRGGRDGTFPLRPYKYEITGPDGTQFSEEGDIPEEVRIAGPAGTYRTQWWTRVPADAEDLFRRLGRTYGNTALPLARPETLEVVKFEPTDRGTSVSSRAQGYWFYVPEEVEEFWIEFGGTGNVNRVTVWNPEGNRAWDLSYSAETPPERVVIDVPPEHRGALWKATGGSFEIDPRIPPYFSLRRTKWFNPEEMD